MYQEAVAAGTDLEIIVFYCYLTTVHIITLPETK